MRKIEKIYYYVIVSILLMSCNQKEINDSYLISVKKLSYPSASSVEFYDGVLYVMGDDATDLLVLDTNLNVIDSIHFIDYAGRRIPKDSKQDLEASALYKDNTGTALFLFGSGSITPNRDKGWWYYFETKIKDSVAFQPLYSQLKKSGINQINIEGACFIYKSLLLSNRGNKNYPINHLIYIDDALRSFWDKDSSFHFKIMPFEPEKDTSLFKGISGLCYSRQSDQLIMTVSTENTRSAYEDGAVGKSYLWVIDSISNKLKSKTVTPDKVIDLEEIDPRFKGQKIESATIIEETKEFMRLVLVADNDDGSSTIFKMSIKKD